MNKTLHNGGENRCTYFLVKEIEKRVRSKSFLSLELKREKLTGLVLVKIIDFVHRPFLNNTIHKPKANR